MNTASVKSTLSIQVIVDVGDDGYVTFWFIMIEQLGWMYMVELRSDIKEKPDL